MYVRIRSEHISPEIQARLDSHKPMSFDEYSSLRMNSYERDAIIQELLDSRALLKVTRHYLQHCSRSSPSTYDHSVKEMLVPMLCDRLEAMLDDADDSVIDTSPEE